MSQLNKIPTFNTPLIEAGRTNKDWFFYFTGLFQKIPPEREAPVVLGPSPYLYTAPRGGFLIVQGGTVSAIEFSRDGTTFYNTGQTQGTISFGSFDQIRITYSVLPNVTFVPT
jgi:hypothetical protein